MKRTYTTTIAATALALGFGVTGCEKKEEKAGAPGTMGAPAGGGLPGMPAPAGGGGGAAAAGSGAGFALFPADSQLLIGVNFGALRSSPMWAKSKDQVEAGLPPEFKELRAECGIDPISELETVIFAGKPQQEENVIVVKGLKRASIKACADKLAAKGEKISITDDGKFSSFQIEGDTAWGAWIDDSTVAIAPKKDKAYVEARVAGTAGLTDASPLMGLLKSVDTSASIYFVADLSTMGALPVPGAKGAFGSMKVSDGLALDAGGRFDTADNAKSALMMATQGLAMVKQKMPPLAKLVDKAAVKQNGNDVILQLNLTAAELEELNTMLQGMAGMLGGMGGGGGGL